jgi:DNA-binding response OmpR family regulator
MAGGDDYMTKPYSLKELSARIRAQLRRGELNHHRGNGGVIIDTRNRMISADGKNVFLSEKEFDLFILFCENPMTTFSKDEIFEAIWKGAKTNPSTVAVHILKLRRKLDEKIIGCIENTYGAGYRFVPPEGAVT